MPPKTELSIYDAIGNENMRLVNRLFSQITPTTEFEAIIKEEKNKQLSLENYRRVGEYFGAMKKKYPELELIVNDTSLDISYTEEKHMTYRCTLYGDHNEKSAVDFYMSIIKKPLTVISNNVIFRKLISESKKQEHSNNIAVMKKIKLPENKIDLTDINVRIRSSQEEQLTKNEFENMTSSTYMDREKSAKIMFRWKKRTSLIVYKTDTEYVRIDLTIVKMHNNYDQLKDTVESYELEIECGSKNKIPNKIILDKMYDTLDKIIKYLQQSNFIITQSESTNVISKYNMLINPPHMRELYGRQPNSLEIQTIELLADKYAITDKADGSRNFLVIFDKKVYLITKNLHVKNTGIIITQDEYTDSIFDGELIFTQRRYVFLIFDCLFIGGKDMRLVSKLEERLRQADLVIENCFIFPGQIGYTYKKYISTGDFSLANITSFHETEAKNGISALLDDLKVANPYIIVRRKYFAHALGAKPWEIFAYASALYNIYTNKDVKCPYILDGLIFQPNDQQYIVDSKTKISKYKDYKWKPPTQNSIDFYIEFEKDEDGNIYTLYDNSGDTISTEDDELVTSTAYLKNKQYRICKLFVGNNVGDEEKKVLFKEVNGLSRAYLFVDNGYVRDEEGNALADKTVVEFYYDTSVSNSDKFRWTPIRTRYDKTEIVHRDKKKYGNYETVANNIWRSIINPILITDFVELAKGNNPAKNLFTYDKKLADFAKKIDHTLVMVENNDNIYHTSKKKIVDDMLQFHNFSKDVLIMTFCHVDYLQTKDGIKKGKTMLDFGIGRAQDAMKAYYAKISQVVGIDFNKGEFTRPADGAYGRYDKFKKTYKNFAQMEFIHGDFGAILDYENQVRSVGGLNNDFKRLIEKYFPVDVEKKIKFDIINIQHAIHYAFANSETFTNLKINIKNHLKSGGFVLITTFDAQKINTLFKTSDKYSQSYTDIDGSVNTLFEIQKKYDDVADGDIIETGNLINVKMAWMDETEYIPEYLVDGRYMTKQFSDDCELDLVSTDTLSNLFKKNKKFFMESAKYESDERTHKNFMKFAKFYDKTQMNEQCRIFSGLYRYYVYRKRLPTPQKGGWVTDDKYIFPSMRRYNPENSIFNSIHYVLRNANFIPRTITPSQLCSDIKYGHIPKDNLFINDGLLNTDELEKLCSYIVIYNEEEDNTKTVIDKISLIVTEINCDGYPEYQMFVPKKRTLKGKITSKQQPPENIIVVMKKDNIYEPVLIKNDDGTTKGLYNIKDKFILDIIAEI